MKKAVFILMALLMVVGLVALTLPTETQATTDNGIYIESVNPNAPPPGYWSVPYYLSNGSITLRMANASVNSTEKKILSSASMVMYVSSNITVSDCDYRDVIIDGSTFSAGVVQFGNFSGLLSGPMSLTLWLSGNVEGKLFVEDNCYDVDVSSNTIKGASPETTYIIGDGGNDSAGSAIFGTGSAPAHFGCYITVGGGSAQALPLDSIATTETSSNLVTSAGTQLNNKTLDADGQSFLQTQPDCLADYVGTEGTLVLTGAALERQISDKSIEYQFSIKMDLSPAPVVTPSPSPSPSASPTTSVSPTPTPSATNVSTTTPTPTLSITPTVTPSPTPTLMISMNAPAKVNHSGNFTARIDFANLNITAGNYSASYVFNYDENVIVATDVTDGLIESSVIPVSNWSFVSEGVQGVISVVQNISSPEAVLNGSGILANISFDVVGGYDNTSDIKFNVSNCSVCVLPDMTSCLPAGWLKGTVRVATPTVQNTYNLTVNQTSSCCNVSVAGYGNVTSGSSRTWSDISSGTVINVNASFNGSCNTWGNWIGSVSNISAMNTTVTMSGTKTIIANCTYTSGPGPVGGSNTPSWLWPVVGVMLFLTLALFGYAANRAGWIGKPKGWFGGHMEDYTADGFGEEDVYDKLYGDTGGIEKGTGGGSDMGNDKL